ncbi:MAG: sigma-70 family RNA polymerase sigma factor [Culicoidibacterales bacterium]
MKKQENQPIMITPTAKTGEQLYTVDNFSVMYQRYQTLVHQQIHKLSIYRDHEDYFQEGMCAIIQALPKLDPYHPNQIGYLTQHVRRRLIDKLRQQQRQTQAITYTDDDQNLEQSHEREYECDLLDCFDPSDHTIIHFVLKGYSTREIAEHLGVHPRTIRRRLQRYQDDYPIEQ